MNFDHLGFMWDRRAVPSVLPPASVERAIARYRQTLAEHIFDAAALEGNPFTYIEVKTLLDGVTVGGHRIDDQDQVLNLAAAAKRLLELVKSGQFRFDKATFTELHGLVAKEEALEWGHFRGEGREIDYTPFVHLGEKGKHEPLATVPGAPILKETFERGVSTLEASSKNAFEKGTAFFLFGAYQQFFFDGNKRTSRMMMNGVLMAAGIDGISVPAKRAQEFNEKMVNFYVSRDATEMMTFLVSCHPMAEQLQKLNSRPSHAQASFRPRP